MRVQPVGTEKYTLKKHILTKKIQKLTLIVFIIWRLYNKKNYCYKFILST